MPTGWSFLRGLGTTADISQPVAPTPLKHWTNMAASGAVGSLQGGSPGVIRGVLTDMIQSRTDLTASVRRVYLSVAETGAATSGF